jgi:acetyl esterase/lipase
MRLVRWTMAVLTIYGLAACKKSSSDDNGNKTMLDVAYGTDAKQKMDIYLPAGRSTTTTKVVIMIHGGAWSLGDKTELNGFVDTFKRRLPDYAIFNINYRLALPPVNIFPTQELDTKAAIEYIYNNRQSYNISDKFILVGASAGAHLALLHAYKYPAPVKIKAVVDFFGPTDMKDLYDNPSLGISQSSLAAIVGGTPASSPAIYQQSSPINFVSTQVCPTIILQGTADPLVNATRQSKALQIKLLTSGVTNQYVEYSGAGHGDWSDALYSDAFNKVQAFIINNVN